MRSSLSIGLIVLLSMSAYARSASSGDITLTTNQALYQVGEQVHFALSNHSGGTIYPTTVPLYVVKRGTLVVRSYSIMNGAFIIKDGESYTAAAWDQKDNNGHQVTPGLYTVTFSGFKGNQQPYTCSVEVEIVRKSNGSMVFNITKRKYKSGETVKFYIINKNVLGASLPNPAPWEIGPGNSFAPDVILYSPITSLEIVPLPAGTRKSWTWDQKDNDGQAVGPGRYHVLFKVLLGNKVKAFVRYFRIIN